MQLVPENTGVYKSQEKHEDDENCFKDATKFKNNIKNVTCEAKLRDFSYHSAKYSGNKSLQRFTFRFSQ